MSYLCTFGLKQFIDFITGLIKAVYTKTLSSEICFKGLLKKITIYLVVATAVIVNNVIGGNIPLREVVITFFICNEGLSYWKMLLL